MNSDSNMTKAQQLLIEFVDSVNDSGRQSADEKIRSSDELLDFIERIEKQSAERANDSTDRAAGSTAKKDRQSFVDVIKKIIDRDRAYYDGFTRSYMIVLATMLDRMCVIEELCDSVLDEIEYVRRIHESSLNSLITIDSIIDREINDSEDR